MPSGADLFVVCKKCGSEVSPYITECPYCGNRLRRRAPKLPRDRLQDPGGGLLRRASLGRLRHGEIAGVRADTPPYVTFAIVIASCALWIAAQGAYVNIGKLVIVGPLDGEWWKLLSSQFVYASGFSAGLFMFSALFAVAIFGSLLERSHGWLLVLGLFFGAGVTGGLAAEAAYTLPLVTGANAGALALLCAWAAPNVIAARAHDYYEADLLGAGAIAVVLLAMPYARPEASWLAGIVGAALGLTVGLGVSRVRSV
jgi:hypothetical protein